MKIKLVYLIEIIKWGFVLWLFLPLTRAMETPIEFARVALGCALFVIFAGKLLYDVVFFPRQYARESSTTRDVLNMVGIVLAITFIVVIMVIFIALFVINYINTNLQNPN